MVNSMKDRYDISVDMGDGKDWWYVHGLATHDKVYGVNKQMCDIGKTILTKNKDIMEEKKTKKMTKAEAFEWLRGTKVVLRTIDDQLDLQKRLFDIGYKWLLSGTQLMKLYDVSCVFFLGIDGFIQHEEYEDESNKLFCDTHVYKPIKLCDILSIEIVEEKYELEFNYDKVVELAKPLMLYLNDIGFQDSIRISQLGIVHEPMSTLIFDNGIGE